MHKNWILISDIHLGQISDSFIESNGLERSINETLKQLDVVINFCIENKTLLFILGDIFEDKNPTARLWDLLNARLLKLEQAGIITWLLGGNHDSNNSSVSALEPICNMNYKNIKVVTEMESYVIENKNVIFLPHLLKSKYKTDEEIQKVMCEFVQKNLDDYMDNYIMAHLQYKDAISGHEAKIMKGGINLFPEIDESKIKNIFLGHLHTRQTLKRNKIWYCGSITRNDFSERDDAKGFIFNDFEHGIIKFMDLDTTAYLQVEITVEKDGKLVQDVKPKDCKDAVIKLIIHCDDYSRKMFNIDDIVKSYNEFGYVSLFEIDVEKQEKKEVEVKDYNPLTYFQGYTKANVKDDKQQEAVLQEGLEILEKVMK